MRIGLSYWATGFVFGLGLLLSGMTQPAKIVGFLDVTGNWDGSLAFVMVGAILVHFILFRLILRRPSPLWADDFKLPSQTRITGSLVVGAALFGVGWGLAGYCPGPTFVAAIAGGRSALLMLLSMLAGMTVFELWQRLRQSWTTAPPAESPPLAAAADKGANHD